MVVGLATVAAVTLCVFSWRSGRRVATPPRYRVLQVRNTALPTITFHFQTLICAQPPLSMIAIVVPAHNESQHIARCLFSLHCAARCQGLGDEAVQIFLVADACTDDTAEVAKRWGAQVLPCEARNVGHARALGAQAALDAGARWLAFTDADTTVAPDWLAQQLLLDSDAVCGTVAVGSWSAWGRLARAMQTHFATTYFDVDGHRHIHGANLGVSAQAYRQAGGFPALASSEDVALVQALERDGASIAWSAAPRVSTSARKKFRAPDGFGATLLRVGCEASRVCAQGVAA